MSLVGRLRMTNEQGRQAAVNTTWPEAWWLNGEMGRRVAHSAQINSLRFDSEQLFTHSHHTRTVASFQPEWENCCKWRNIVSGPDPDLLSTFRWEIDSEVCDGESSQPAEPPKETDRHLNNSRLSALLYYISCMVIHLIYTSEQHLLSFDKLFCHFLFFSSSGVGWWVITSSHNLYGIYILCGRVFFCQFPVCTVQILKH